MSVNTISNALFSIETKNLKEYELHVQFVNNNQHVVSDRKFTFIQKEEIEKGYTLDVFTQNATCEKKKNIKEIWKHIFRQNKDEKKYSKSKSETIATALNYNIQSENQPAQRIFVLDLQDPQTRYTVLTPIENYEKIIDEFLRTDLDTKKSVSDTEKINTLFKKYQVNFVLHEGSLKFDILNSKAFSPQEIEFFQDHSQGPNGERSPGPLLFCQCAEFFMNAFKFGQEAQGGESSFLASKYIVPLAEGAKFHPQEQSVVLFPPYYKDAYSSNGAYTQAISSRFSVNCELDEKTDITTMQLKMKDNDANG